MSTNDAREPLDEAPGSPPTDASKPITELLERARKGDRAAVDDLFARVYRELHGLARAQLALRGRPGSTLDTTALVHEAYLRMAGRESLVAEDRAHFFSLAARVMRHLVVDAFRRRDAVKHGGASERVDLERAHLPSLDSALSADVLALDVALQELEAASPHLARLVEMRFFAGLPLPEMVPLLGRSERTLKREWRRARAFLLARLAGDSEGSAAR